MKTLRACTLVALLALGLGLVACKSTLAPGGFYAPTNALGQAAAQPDKAFYIVDGSFATAYATIDAAFSWERKNRAELWKLSPGIKHTLDQIRPNAIEARAAYIRARQAYLLNRIPANLTDLQSALFRVQAVSSAVLASLPQNYPH